MSINFKNALGIHPDALNVRSKRSEILANNLANSDTPGFKARDLDFKGILQGEYENRQRMELSRTSQRHIPAEGVVMDSSLKFRIPHQPAIDGNTVETNIEQAEFAKNAMDFQSSFTFLNSRFTGLVKAMKEQG
ncbi:flagellar basal body rod protein FlgB [Marinospirillum alkaliphilum]|uniref:Flagellar basal body rod protein FlgB n=1 Tax=Marinospirillum alkaliphilum DSM 21637 TaxID=1122209 RepID=A0A1K1V077_9GAMM|nr:flagellar basal body rod protein FlgB [Marinospirillum alkaliphilum]SFX18188.1 flagellar basal-body rod protein FlgB [Marinospirillum alkaliphilum DSM 21637]